MRKILLFLIAVTFVILLTAPGALAQMAKDDMKTFYFGTIQEPTSLDPATIWDGSDRITRQIYDTLVNYKGSTFEPEPNLAKSWEVSSDFRVYTLHLQQGVTFSDGTPFNAEAVKFSITRMMKIGKAVAYAFKMMMGKWNETQMAILDPYTIRITLKSSFPAFLGLLGSRYAAPIISPSVMQHEVGGDLAAQWAIDHAIGTGPYMLDHWTRKVEVVLVENPNYWKGWDGNHVERIVEKIIPEPSTQRLMLESGELDAATHITMDDLAQLRNNPDINIVDTTGYSTFDFFVLMNTNKGPLKDIRLRQALSYAFEYDGCINTVFSGFAIQSVGPIPIAMQYPNQNLFVYHRDMAKAKELMTEAGYPNGGLTLSITYMSGQDWAMKILGVLTSNLGELGITLQPIPLTWSAMIDKITNQDTAPDMSVVDWWPDYPDIDGHVTGLSEQYFWGGRAPKDYWYYNSTLIELLANAAVEPDPAKRKDMYIRAQQIFIADAPAIWVLDLSLPVPLRKEVHGYVYNSMYEMTYTVYNLWKEPVSKPVTTESTTTAAPSQAFPMEYVLGIAVVIIAIVGIAIYRRKSKK